MLSVSLSLSLYLFVSVPSTFTVAFPSSSPLPPALSSSSAMGLEVPAPAARDLILDGSTVRSFATDTEAFNAAVDPQFRALDVDGDGVLSRAELRPAFERLNLLDLHFGVPVSMTPAELTALYDSVFEDFDTDHDNTVDLPEFRSSLKQILLAIADGLGSAPLTMIVEPGSLLGDAADHETSSRLSVRPIDANNVPPASTAAIPNV